MHLIPAIPGGWNPNGDGVFYIDHTPGDLLFLSAADTELHSFNEGYKMLAETELHVPLPTLRLANLIHFKHELTIDKYIEETVAKAKVIICRMLGGKGYYPYLFQSLVDLCKEKKIVLLLLPGYSEPDYELFSASTADVHFCNQVWKYLCAGGKENSYNCLKYLTSLLLGLPFTFQPPQSIKDLFLFHPEHGILEQEQASEIYGSKNSLAAIIVYQAHYLSDNLAPVHYLYQQLLHYGMDPIIVFVHHLRDESTVKELYTLLTNNGSWNIKVIINTTSFSIKSLKDNIENDFVFSRIKAPVIQAIFASCTKEVWEENLFGLPPTDIAINISLPEIDGRIITTAISFKANKGKDPLTEAEISNYATHENGCNFIAKFSKSWINLQNKVNEEKKIAIIIPNYPNKDSRLANGVGLDTPESCIRVLQSLKKEGYDLGEYIPGNGNELIHLITHYITNSLDDLPNRPYQISITRDQFYRYYNQYPFRVREKIEASWGKPEDSPLYTDEAFALPGIMLGNIFLSIQPARGYNQDPKAIYHSPDLPPTFDYIAFYTWINECLKPDAVIHIGKHGNLEWLPGKSVVLDPSSCFPALLFGPIPHFYPFIVNDPGEGTQAKRRNHAVIIDHLIPPMTRAETYGDLTRLEHLIDEYYEACNQDVKRTNALKVAIKKLVKKTHLHEDVKSQANDINELLVRLDGYLCDLKEAQIRDGLHIFGECPQNEQLVDLLIALHRNPTHDLPGITQAMARDLNWPFDPLNCEFATEFHVNFNGAITRTFGDAVEQLEIFLKSTLKLILYPAPQRKILIAEECLEELSKQKFDLAFPLTFCVLKNLFFETLNHVLDTKNEIKHLLEGLNGLYVPSGPSGAPTRGNLNVLPTGRNFYSVDVRTIPTQIAYQLGEKSAQLIVERYIQENGNYPESIGLSVWGTSTMRTGGDDIAQAFALMGIKPKWQGPNRRVIDFEVIPLLLLKRPRIDVLLRISGFFRDAFPDVVSLFNAAVERIAQLDEPLDQNPIRKKYLMEKEDWMRKGLLEAQAEKRALYRVFGSKPGAYGAGLQAMIDEKNWESHADLSKVYIQWGGYAYGNDRQGESAHEVFEIRLSAIQLVMHNQDNREHDILDSDDYYQFQGGMANAVKTMKGKAPDIYFGDHSRPSSPKVKTLQEELLKVYRSRVVNPKWIEGVKRHGYKGAFEMAATMDYLFAYDATTGLIEDFMYEGITQEYLFNNDNQQFIKNSNPWALKDMTERMLEAIQRGMWKNPKDETKLRLQEILLELE